MKGLQVVCAAVCGLAAGIALSHTGSSLYVQHNRVSLPPAPPAPFATELTGSVVAIDIPNKAITLRIMSPYDASPPFVATFDYNETTTFHIANANSQVGAAGISHGQFPVGTKVQATVVREPGALHLDALFGSAAL